LSGAGFNCPFSDTYFERVTRIVSRRFSHKVKLLHPDSGALVEMEEK
jgi:hypothetical protein